jgi:phage gp36-like protein
MTYAVKNDMIARFGEREVVALTDRDETGVVDDAVLTQGLVTADAEINAYLAGRVALPLATPPLILIGYACDIARYRLTGANVIETDVIGRRYKDAIDFLKLFATSSTVFSRAESAQS